MENAEKIEKMTFKDYYQSLDEEMKKSLETIFGRKRYFIPYHSTQS